MGLRFRRTIYLLPGLRLNVVKRGPTVSVGRRGAHVTLGHGQVRETVGLPLTGLSYTHVDKTSVKSPVAEHAPAVTDVPRQARPLSLGRALAALAAFLVMLAMLVRLVRQLQ